MDFEKKKLNTRKILIFLSVIVALLLLGVTWFLVTHHKKTSASSPATSIAAECKSATSTTQFTCYKEHYDKVVKTQDVPTAYKILKADYITDDYTKANCHQLTHVIGRSALDRYVDLATTFEHGDNYCWSGYYHGSMEEVASKLGKDKVLAELNTICATFAQQNRYSFYHYNCVHGLGHGVMEVQDGELFAALDSCNTLSDSWEAESCYGGVFMENVMEDASGTKSKYLRVDEPLYPCTAVADQYKTQCYLMQTSYALQHNGYDFAKTYALCASVGEPYRATCYQSLGRDASGSTTSDITRTTQICQSGSDYEAQSNCIVGAVKDVISYYHSDVQAKQLCAGLVTTLQDICNSTAVEYYKSF